MGNLEGPYLNRQQRGVSRVIIHPYFNSINNNNDIALLELTFPVVFNNYVMPVCLAAANSDFPPKTDVWVTGWGDIRFGGE